MSSTEQAAVRVAVVGAGLMGRWHAHFARRLGARVVAVVDREPGAVRALARRAGNAAEFADMGVMLREIRPLAVHICTPLATHAGLALQAVDAGVHALVEKPLTPFAEQASALLRQAQDRAVYVCPVHQFAFQRGVTRAARLLGALGDALHASFTICSAGGGDDTGAALDRIVADILPHPFSVLQALWPGKSIRAEDWSARSARPGELQAQGAAGGVAVEVRISMSARPTRCDLEILCTRGSVHLDFFHGYGFVRRGAPSRAGKIAQPFLLAAKSSAVAAANLAWRALRGELAYPGLGELIARFHAAARGTGPNPVPPEDALAVAALREHVIRQAIPGALHEPRNP